MDCADPDGARDVATMRAAVGALVFPTVSRSQRRRHLTTYLRKNEFIDGFVSETVTHFRRETAEVEAQHGAPPGTAVLVFAFGSAKLHGTPGGRHPPIRALIKGLAQAPSLVLMTDEYLTSQVDALVFAQPHDQFTEAHSALMKMGGLRMSYHRRHHHWTDAQGQQHTENRTVHRRAHSALRPGASFDRDFNSGRLIKAVVDYEIARVQNQVDIDVMDGGERRPFWMSPVSRAALDQADAWLAPMLHGAVVPPWAVAAQLDLAARRAAFVAGNAIPAINPDNYLI
eukprot:TRINITY_DN1290_c0_g1_i7.p1 TRINITY_DN1290_c0_g1~~TRINITY_DN1290_c0_g1_i7.p1  ORF type:complete len:285 (+),score=11.77 TRINITY_DN1290_c0_g1_i7:796-1650(+)